MTSSLVGSEMCIRDRALLGPKSFIKTGRAGDGGWHMLVALPHRRSGTRAVSYTHLTLPTICSV
eukprot:2660424-Prorocentrum_lima.AAC.1